MKKTILLLMFALMISLSSANHHSGVPESSPEMITPSIEYSVSPVINNPKPDWSNILYFYTFDMVDTIKQIPPIITIIALIILIFWIKMLIHVVKNRELEYQPVWILIVWLMGIVGAVIYYFIAVKESKSSCCMMDEDVNQKCCGGGENCSTCDNEICVCK